MDIETLKARHHELLDKQYTELQADMLKDPAVHEFVMLVSDKESGLGDSLRSLCYEIGWTLDPGYVSFPSELGSFIGNCFYDDSLWTLYRDEGCWEAARETMDPCIKRHSQDPRVLIAAARENRAYYDTLDALHKEKGIEAFLDARRKFQTSAEILIPFGDNHFELVQRFRQTRNLEDMEHIITLMKTRYGEQDRRTTGAIQRLEMAGRMREYVEKVKQ